MATISELIQRLSPGTIIEGIEIDATSLGDQKYYFHDGTNELNGAVTWQGQLYSAFPYKLSGFEERTSGTLPKPKLQLANVTGLITPLLKDFDDFIGVKVTRKRTFLRYLDAINFEGGVNPEADPNSYLPDDVYYIDRKSNETRVTIEFELASSLDLNKIKLPRRQIIQNTCQWIYKNAECSYAGGAVADIYDNLTSDPDLDACGKRLVSCKIRYGEYAVLPYGGFIGAGRV